MKITTYHGLQLASGLTWSIFDPYSGSLHKQISNWRTQGQTHGVKYAAMGEEIYGRTDARGQGCLSVAALVAHQRSFADKDVLVLIEVPALSEDLESTVLVVGLIRGVVELDDLVYASEVAAVRQGFAQRTKTYELHGEGAEIGEVDFAFGMEQLLQSKAAKTKIGPIRSQRLPIITGAIAAVGLLAAVGWLIWSSYTDAQRAEFERLRLQAQTPQALYHSAAALYTSTPVVPLASAIDAVRGAMANFPVVHAGWELKTLTCQAKGGCTAHWKRPDADAGTFDDFVALANEGWAGISLVKQDELVHGVALEMPTAQLPTKEAWPSFVDWTNRNVSHWQFLAPGGWKAEIKDPKLQGLPAGVAGTTAEAGLIAHPAAIKAATLAIEKQAWWYADKDAHGPLSADLIGENTTLLGDVVLHIEPKSISFSTKGLVHVR